jgi:hypothetical protein
VALTQTRTQIRANVRRLSDTGGTNALVRHPDADLNEYIDLALGALHRALSEGIVDQRYLASTPIALSVVGGSTYALPAAFDHLISVDLVANGHKSWLTAYEMHERPSLTSADTNFTGTPLMYRLRASNIEYLPAPSGSFTSTLWYVPTPTQFTTDGETFDTVNRLDTFLVAYAARFIAVRDKNTTLVGLCDELIGELREDIAMVARARDKNSPPRVVNEMLSNRWGRPVRGRR